MDDSQEDPRPSVVDQVIMNESRNGLCSVTASYFFRRFINGNGKTFCNA